MSMSADKQAFRRVLCSADRLSERAISRGASQNTPCSRSSESLRAVTVAREGERKVQSEGVADAETTVAQ